ncbi:MAG: recombinase family protein [Myxococcales bacterium]|nr:recombinase family protein [Myxococcales bacterium]
MSLRAVVYCRVSTKEQAENHSLGTQQRDCELYCDRNHLDVDQVFIEPGESAKTADRPELRRMMTYCRENKGRVQFLVVYSVSRLARDKYDHATIRAYLASCGITLRSATEPIDDTSTGKLMEGILSAFAQFDNDVRADRTVAGMRASVQKGRWSWQPPLGYMKGVPGGSSMMLDPERAPLLAQAIQEYASGGRTKSEVLHRATALGLRSRSGKKVPPQTFASLLKNPLMMGRIVLPKWEIDVRGDFDPIVDERTFLGAQAVSKGLRPSPKPHATNNPEFPLRGFVKCGRCDTPLTGSSSGNRTGKKYPYYSCRKKGCGVRVPRDTMHKQFLELLCDVQPDPKFAGLFREIVIDAWQSRRQQAASLRTACESQLQELRRRKDRLVEACVHKRLLDEETFRDQMSRVEEDIALARMELHQADLDELDIEAVLAFAEHAMSNAANLWHQFPLELRQRFQAVLFPEGLAHDGEGFGTAETCCAFRYLDRIGSSSASLATPTGFEHSSLSA